MTRKLFYLFLIFLILHWNCSDDAASPDVKLNNEFSLVYPADSEAGLIPGFEFKWTKSQSAISYNLNVFNEYGSDEYIIHNITDLTYILELKYNSIYRWNVIAIDENGNRTKTADQTFITKINSFVWNDNFPVPQLNTAKRIWVYLPPDYDSTEKEYPVIYLHDGWQVFVGDPALPGGLMASTTLDELFQTVGFSMIAVAINNGGESRLNELSPWVNEGSYESETSNVGQGGKGDEYLNFIIETLKPTIDKEFRTLTDGPNTCIGGTSLGGLISYYAGIKYPQVFGKVIALSPSFWYTDQKIFTYTEENANKLTDNKFYFWAGSTEVWEDIDLPGEVDKVISILQDHGFNNYKYNFESGGAHSHLYWSRSFREAINYLFIE